MKYSELKAGDTVWLWNYYFKHWCPGIINSLNLADPEEWIEVTDVERGYIVTWYLKSVRLRDPKFGGKDKPKERLR